MQEERSLYAVPSVWT